MRMRLATLILAMALAAMTGAASATSIQARQAHALSSAPKKPKKCHFGAYKHGRCATIPQRGHRFQVKIPKDPGAHALQGNGNSHDAGTNVVVQHVSVPTPPTKNAHVFVVVANGTFPPMKLSKSGKLYKYDVRTGTWARVSSITAQGIYAVSPQPENRVCLD